MPRLRQAFLKEPPSRILIALIERDPAEVTQVARDAPGEAHRSEVLNSQFELLARLSELALVVAHAPEHQPGHGGSDHVADVESDAQAFLTPFQRTCQIAGV